MTNAERLTGITANVIDGQFWLDAAHASVRRFCRWHVAPRITETLTLDGEGGKTLLIPSGRVIELQQAISDGVDVTDRVDASARGIVEMQSGSWSRRLGGISITLEHGYDVEEIPDVAAIIIGVAKRAKDAMASRYASRSVNGAAVTEWGGGRGGGQGPLAVPLLQTEEDALRELRVEYGA